MKGGIRKLGEMDKRNRAGKEKEKFPLVGMYSRGKVSTVFRVLSHQRVHQR